MQFWAVCGICLYVGLVLFNWVSGLHWLAGFSLPLSILGGMSLAIASNTAKMPAQQTLTEDPVSPSSEQPDSTQNSSVIPQPKTSQPPSPSISFTINKNV